MKKKIISWIVVICAAALCGVIASSMNSGTEKVLYGISSGNIDFTDDPENDITDVVLGGEEYVVDENENFRLSLTGNADIAVTDKRNNRVYKAVSETAAAENDKYGSSLAIHYNIGASNETVLYSMSECVAKNQIKVYKSGSGVRVEYIFGEYGLNYIYPDIVSKERFEEILSMMQPQDAEYVSGFYTLYINSELDGESRKIMLAEYPQLEYEDLYICNVTAKMAKKKMSAIFTSIGYTEEDRARDMGTESEVEHSKTFKVPVKYELTDTGFSAVVNTGECVFYSEYPVTSIELLPFFDGFTSEEEGYLLYPSGSGALIDISSDKNKTEQSLSTRIYGEDILLSQKMFGAAESAQLPVFGAYKNNGGYLCVLSEGCQQATVNADRSAVYSSVYPVYMLIDYAQYSMAASNDINLFANDFAIETVKSEYILLNELNEENAYSQMAECYRERLIDEGVLTEKSSDGVSLLAEIKAVIDYDTMIAGSIPVNREYALTTFAQVEEMASELSDTTGSENLFVLLDGWNKKGLGKKQPGRLNYSNEAGGKKGFENLAGSLSDMGITLFADTVFNEVVPSFADGYNVTDQSARGLNNKIVYPSRRDLQTNEYSIQTFQLISPTQYEKLFNKYNALPEKVGLCVNDLTGILYGDYKNGVSFSRGDSIKSAVRVLSEDQDRKIIGNYGNLYALAYMDMVNNLSTKSSDNNMFYCSVPFIQMVLHGYVDYVTPELNGASDINTSLLKAIETGSGLHYTLTANRFDKLFDTEFNYLYDTYYSDLRNTVFDSYEYVRTALDGLGTKKITSHCYMTNEVTKTEYSNGTEILVNYGETNYVYDGKIVSSGSYLRIDNN